jgi:hypothetical protein
LKAQGCAHGPHAVLYDTSSRTALATSPCHSNAALQQVHSPPSPAHSSSLKPATAAPLMPYNQQQLFECTSHPLGTTLTPRSFACPRLKSSALKLRDSTLRSSSHARCQNNTPTLRHRSQTSPTNAGCTTATCSHRCKTAQPPPPPRPTHAQQRRQITPWTATPVNVAGATEASNTCMYAANDANDVVRLHGAQTSQTSSCDRAFRFLQILAQ